MTERCPHWLRQWLAGPAAGESRRMPCADPSCPDGSPGECLDVAVLSERHITARAILDGAVPIQNRRFARQQIAPGLDRKAYRWRWVEVAA